MKGGRLEESSQLFVIENCKINFRCVGWEQAGGRISRHDVPHLPDGQHVTGGGEGGGGGAVLAPSRENQGDHDQLSQGDRGEYPEVSQDREGDIPRVQGG